VGIAARRLDLMMSGMHLELSKHLDLSAAEVLALAHLSLDGALGPTDLALRLHMSTGAMTALLDRLVARAFIVREPHPSDRRRVVVTLTDGGRDELFDRVHGMAAEVMTLTDRLTSDERRVVGRFLDDVAALLARTSTRAGRIGSGGR
jgi:MarR family multiple antibiotic resistance transcriptional regulator